jgi:lysophospholipase L1-like esterase
VISRLTGGKTVRIVAYGDSISEVGRTPNYFGGATCAEMNWAQQLGRLLWKGFGKPMDVAHFAIGGQNAYEGLGRLDWLKPFEADLVLIAFGANDCGYHYIPPDATALAIASMIDGVRARHGADVVVFGPGGGNPAIEDPKWQHLDETIDAIRKVALDKNAPFADVRAGILKETNNGARWVEYHNGPQDCHPNDAGHGVWARVAFDTIKPHLKF